MKNDQGGSERGEQRLRADRTPRLSDDRLYRALASTRRRRLLYLLLEKGESTVENVVTVLTGWNATETGTMKEKDDREHIAISLEHVHLPLLAETDLVDYDRESGTVRVEPLDAAVKDLIRRSVEAGPLSVS